MDTLRFDRVAGADGRCDEFLAVLAHELRNHLAPIRCSLQVLDRAAPECEQALRAREVIGRQVGHMARLVDDLLEVARIARNKIRLELETLDLRDVARHCVEDHRSMFEQSGVQLESSLPPDPVFVRADPSCMAQVIGNLLQNAVKFAGPDGAARLSLGMDAPSGRAVLRVTDTGVGMSQDTLAALFQPFVQEDRTRDRAQGGLGLGLAIVRGLVELHQGEVLAQSAGPGLGAEFVVRLPIDAQVEQATEPASVTSRR